MGPSPGLGSRSSAIAFADGSRVAAPRSYSPKQLQPSVSTERLCNGIWSSSLGQEEPATLRAMPWAVYPAPRLASPSRPSLAQRLQVMGFGTIHTTVLILCGTG